MGLDGGSSAERARSVLFDSEETVCVFNGYSPRAVFVGVGTVMHTDIRSVLDEDIEAEVRVAQVHGFPAVRVTPRRFTKFCSVFVEVGPDDLIDVQFSDGGRQPAVPQERLCSDAEQVAQVVVGNLLAR